MEGECKSGWEVLLWISETKTHSDKEDVELHSRLLNRGLLVKQLLNFKFSVCTR